MAVSAMVAVMVAAMVVAMVVLVQVVVLAAGPGSQQPSLVLY